METPRRNVELKAVDPQPAASLAAALTLGAQDRGELLQRDTYFAVTKGRLKLREQEGRAGAPRAQLIAYVRPDDPTVRVSEYRLAPVTAPGPLLDALGASLGVRVVVAKRRRLLVWEAVRIHLDDVEGLGSFVELEAVAPEGSDLGAERARVARLRAALHITDDRLRQGSYADALAPQPDGVRRTVTMGGLLPLAFGPEATA